jgi:hypothetical protein
VPAEPADAADDKSFRTVVSCVDDNRIAYIESPDWEYIVGELTTDAEVDLEVLRSVPKQFSIGDENTANWLVKKVTAAREYAANVKKWAELELKRAEREEHCLMFLFGRQIESWAQSEIAKKGGKRKSINLPAGSVGFRITAAALRVDDEAKVIVWARTNCPSAVEVVTTTKLSRGILTDHYKSTGEIPDSGAHVEPQKEKFHIT